MLYYLILTIFVSRIQNNMTGQYWLGLAAACTNSGNITEYRWATDKSSVDVSLYNLWDFKQPGYGINCAVMSDRWSATVCGGRFGVIEERQAVVCQYRTSIDKSHIMQNKI